MKKTSFFDGKKVVIFTSKDQSEQEDEKTIVVRIVGTITKGAATQFVYMVGKTPKMCDFTQIKEMYESTPLTEKAFSAFKSRYAKVKKTKFNFGMKNVNWKFRRPSFNFATSGPNS
jgi:hypothetical protein